MIITLPFPPSELNPNKRLHWAQKVKIKNEYKAICADLVKDHVPCMKAGHLPIKLTFYPAHSTGDLDNMLAAMKSGIDGMAQAWGINDRHIRPITIDKEVCDRKNPRVEIEFKLKNTCTDPKSMS